MTMTRGYRAPTELISSLPSIIFKGDHVSEALEVWIEIDRAGWTYIKLYSVLYMCIIYI